MERPVQAKLEAGGSSYFIWLDLDEAEATLAQLSEVVAAARTEVARRKSKTDH